MTLLSLFHTCWNVSRETAAKMAGVDCMATHPASRHYHSCGQHLSGIKLSRINLAFFKILGNCLQSSSIRLLASKNSCCCKSHRQLLAHTPPRLVKRYNAPFCERILTLLCTAASTWLPLGGVSSGSISLPPRVPHNAKCLQ